MVDRTTLRPTPLPDREKLLSVCFEEPSVAHLPTNDQVDADIPKHAYCWPTSARITDCDSLGHINNTKYATLAEEAVLVAHNARAFDGSPDALSFFERNNTSIHIEYMEQILPFMLLELYVWYDSSEGAFFVRTIICSTGKVASTVLLGVPRIPPTNAAASRL
jgi:acyl-CoA thioesterase FadM